MEVRGKQAFGLGTICVAITVSRSSGDKRIVTNGSIAVCITPGMLKLALSLVTVAVSISLIYVLQGLSTLIALIGGTVQADVTRLGTRIFNSNVISTSRRKDRTPSTQSIRLYLKRLN